MDSPQWPISRDVDQRPDLGVYDPDRVPGLVSRWILTLPHLSKQSIWSRAQLRTLADLTVPAMHAWMVARTQTGKPASNNYVRQRVSVLKLFIEWLEDEQVLPSGFGRRVDFKYFRTEYPRLYGSVQAPSKGRFLHRDEAQQLIEGCKDGTWIGSRDQLVIRFGLLGLRRAEICGLVWGDYDGEVVRKLGKRNRMREVRPGPTMTELLAKWRRRYEAEIGRPVTDRDPLLVGVRINGAGHQPILRFDLPLDYTTVGRIFERRGQAAGLGKVKAHDARRATAQILHDARSADGGHLYDLLDIQKALDHTSPDTTQRSYIDHMNTSVKKAAGITLDL